MNIHWQRLKRSLGRRWKEWRLPRGYRRLGTRYGGWWLDTRLIGVAPLLIDCGLGEDISFPCAFLQRFGGKVVGVEPNPRSLAYCTAHPQAGMAVLQRAFWHTPDETLSFHLPRAQHELPKGADGVSGSLIDTHDYVGGGDSVQVQTIDLLGVLRHAGREDCDVLKLDIEGAEYDVLQHLADSGELRRVAQLLIEFHHGVTHHALTATQATVRRIEACDFRLMHVEGRNYIFRRINKA